jgi:phosphatidate cytidylyltransferase
MNMLKRTATAAILIPLVLVGLFYFSRLAFFILIQVVILASLLEFYNLPRKKKIFPARLIGVLLALIISASVYFPQFPLALALFICLFILGLYYLLTIDRLEKLMQFPAAVSLTLLGAVYLSFTLNYFNLLREDFGPLYIIFLLAVINIGDSVAMLAGRWWGKHKFAPIASPKKTWEGSLGGVLSGIAAGVAFQQIFLPDQALLWKTILIAALIQAVAQISDPIESLFKRASGVKDSSNLLPGHGGFFDRVDSLILATPFFYYILVYFGMN